MNRIDYRMFCTFAKMSQEELLRVMRKYLKKTYSADKIMATKDFIVCEGDIPIALVAHLDTVFRSPPRNIYHDTTQHVIWSPQGLGADDRAGVFAIFKILEEGLRPHVILTTDEEKGGIGAQTLAMLMPRCLFNLKYMIELDRQGDYDCVFYSCANKSFQKYIEQYGFVTDWGSFSDISILCPQWKVAGVNLSVGYKNEHSNIETLHTTSLHSTIKTVIKMLKNANESPYFEYIVDPLELDYWGNFGCYAWGFPGEDDELDLPPDIRNKHKNVKCQCWGCLQTFNPDDVFEVQDCGYAESIHYYCLDCKRNICINCFKYHETHKYYFDKDYRKY